MNQIPYWRLVTPDQGHLLDTIEENELDAARIAARITTPRRRRRTIRSPGEQPD